MVNSHVLLGYRLYEILAPELVKPLVDQTGWSTLPLFSAA
jgi:hypothetical protein